MLTLFYAPGFSSMASHIALEEGRAEYVAILINEDTGQQRGDAYLRINPRGKVPALQLSDGMVLVENIAIQTYVARTHPHANLLPTDPVAEARAFSLMSFFASADVQHAHRLRIPFENKQINAGAPVRRSIGSTISFSFTGSSTTYALQVRWLKDNTLGALDPGNYAQG